MEVFTKDKCSDGEMFPSGDLEAGFTSQNGGFVFLFLKTETLVKDETSQVDLRVHVGWVVFAKADLTRSASLHRVTCLVV